MRESISTTKINHHFVLKYQENIAQKAKFLIAELGYKLEEVLLISDKRIWQKYRKSFGKDFTNNVGKTLIFNDLQADKKFIDKIIDNFKNLKLIIAVGSGTVNDLAKYSAFLTKKKLRYFSYRSFNEWFRINQCFNYH